MSATLDGITLYPDDRPSWGERRGTGPYIRTFHVDAAEGKTLVGGASLHGSSIRIGTEVYSGLSILGMTTGTLPGTRRVVVADRRWALPRTLVKRSFNMPKTSTDRRRLPGSPLSVSPMLDDRVYHRWSLVGERSKWFAEGALRRVMDDAFGAAGWTGHVPAVSNPVEGLSILAPGDVAIGQILTHLGRAIGLKVNKKGLAELYLTDAGQVDQAAIHPATGDPGSAPGASGKPSLQGGPQLIQRSRLLERPAWIDVYYQRSVEVRVDSHEVAIKGDTEEDNLDNPPPRAGWVLKLPEDITNFAGRTVVAGTWVRGQVYLDYLVGLQLGGLPPVDRRLLRSGYLSPVLAAYGAPNIDPSGLWAIRAHALHSTYRRVFGLRPEWVDVLRKPVAKLSTVIDPEHGTTAPAAVYQDYAEWITWRWLVDGDSGQPPPGVVRNVRANTTQTTGGGIVGTPLEDLRQAPAGIKFLDRDNFIFQVSFLTDWQRQVDRLLPSALDELTIPTNDPADDQQWASYGILSEEHEVSVVFSAMLGAPNSKGALYRDRVYPTDIGAGESLGPPIEMIENNPLRVARHAWDDSRASAFTVGILHDARSITRGLGLPANASELWANSLSRARSTYYRYQDTLVGGTETDIDAAATLKGRIGSVEHTSGPGGVTTTTIWPLDPPFRSADSFLPLSVRAMLSRFVTPDRS